MPNAASANEFLLVSREQMGSAIGKALRLFVGRGRRYSVKELSNGTGVKDRVIECALCRPDSLDYRPLPQEALGSIMLFLGAEFTNHWIGITGQGAFDLPDEEPDPGALAADNSDDNAALTRMALDGSFANDPAAALRVTGTRLMSRGAQLVAVAGGRA